MSDFCPIPSAETRPKPVPVVLTRETRKEIPLFQLCPGAVLQKLDKLVEPLRTTVTTKVKANAVKQEYEKQDELKRSAMRAVAALMAIPGAGE